MAVERQGQERSRYQMSKKHPYYRIVDDEDLDRETHRRKERHEVIQAKKFIGSGEDADFVQQLNHINDFPVDQESHAS
jgi:hypothetical protein